MKQRTYLKIQDNISFIEETITKNRKYTHPQISKIMNNEHGLQLNFLINDLINGIQHNYSDKFIFKISKNSSKSVKTLIKEINNLKTPEEKIEKINNLEKGLLNLKDYTKNIPQITSKNFMKKLSLYFKDIEDYLYRAREKIIQSKDL